MGRKNNNKRKRKRQLKRKTAFIQGREFHGGTKVTPLNEGCFAYEGYIFDSTHFPEELVVIFLDESDVQPIAKYTNNHRKKHKVKAKNFPKSCKAWLYTNAKEYFDVQEITAT